MIHKTPPGPPPLAPPPALEDNEPIYFVRTLDDQQQASLIPTTVADLFEAKAEAVGVNNQTVGDLYKILLKVVAENKNLKQCLEENELILLEVEAEHKKDGASGNPDEDPAASGSTSTSGMKSKLGLLDKKKDKKDKNKKQNQNNDKTKEAVTAASAINEADKPNIPSEERLTDLTQRLQTAETEVQQLQDALEQMSAQKAALERDLASVQSDNANLRANGEAIAAEKWELANANADLQNRLQTVSYMQGVPDTMLQEEVRKLHIALSDERKVTEKLSRNLELEKRRSESLEQKAKSAFRRSGATSNSNAVFLPEELRQRDETVQTSMEKFRDQCDQLVNCLQECEEKLTGFEIQEEYHVADLRKELGGVKKLLIDEKKKSGNDSTKLVDLQNAFGHCLKSYQESIDNVNKAKSEDNNSSSARASHDNKSPSKVESLQTKLVQAQEDLRDERRRSDQLSEKLRKCQADLETLPLLQAQVEVYQTDFNAERLAREKIAGEKADLLEEMQRLRGGQGHPAEAQAQPGHDPERRQRQRTPPEIATGTVRDAVHHFAETNRYDPPPVKTTEKKIFSCPKCNKTFPLLTLLQNHVNACLDRDD